MAWILYGATETFLQYTAEILLIIEVFNHFGFYDSTILSIYPRKMETCP